MISLENSLSLSKTKQTDDLNQMRSFLALAQDGDVVITPGGWISRSGEMYAPSCSS